MRKALFYPLIDEKTEAQSMEAGAIQDHTAGNQPGVRISTLPPHCHVPIDSPHV